MCLGSYLSAHVCLYWDPIDVCSWRREWQSTPVFLPGEFHGQWSLVGYSPWGHKESDTTEQHTHTHTQMSALDTLGSSCLWKALETGGLTADPKMSGACVHFLALLDLYLKPTDHLSKTWLSSKAANAADIFGDHLAAPCLSTELLPSDWIWLLGCRPWLYNHSSGRQHRLRVR